MLEQSVRYRIHVMADAGMTLRGIARRLNEDRVPTAHGGKRWHAETVKRVLGA